MSDIHAMKDRMWELQQIIEKDRELAAMGYFTNDYMRARSELQELRLTLKDQQP